MRVFLAACLMTGFSAAAFAQNAAADWDRRIAACSTFTACFRLLDLDDEVARNRAPDIARRLEQFGDSAKRQLLTRALVRDRKVTETVDAADIILRYWQNWSESDIPELRRILRANTDSQVGWALVKIGTAESIRVLVEDASQYGGAESAEPIAAVGERALPHIVTGLATEDWQRFGSLLWYIGDKISLPNQTWASEAADATKPINQRVIALRALASQRSMSDAVRQALEPLLLDPNREIQFETVRAIRSTKGTASAEALAQACPARDDAFTSRDAQGFNIEWWNCLRDFADFGSAARPFGVLIVSRFLGSPNGADRADGATVLGFHRL